MSCSPLTSDPNLRNIFNGIVAGSDVNVRNFELGKDHGEYDRKVSIYLKIQAEILSQNPW